MPSIHISVQNRVARVSREDRAIVCGNGDYTVVFSFDEEWQERTERVARFIWNGAYYDVAFTGDTCPMPLIIQAPTVEVGVYAGTLCTTTPAVLRCRPSIRSDVTIEATPEAVEEYNNQAQAAAAEARAAALVAQSAAEAATLHATEIAAHAAARRECHSFVVGQASELAYMTADSSGIYSISQAFRYNDKSAHTTYRYPLSSTERVSSAVWHAHLAQQVRLSLSVDGEHWVVLHDTAGQQIGSQRHYELCDKISLEGAEAIYLRISDSNPADGFGGAILADMPVTLTLTYGETLAHLLPSVSTADEGSHLRVLGGRWQVAGPQDLVSRVYTYDFQVGTMSEGKYLTPESTGYLNDSCRFNDGVRVTVYRYRIANAALVRRALWTATVGQQLKLECSVDGEHWTVLENTGASVKPFTRETYDLTEHLNLLAFDEIYIRISDSNPADGFGGAVSRTGRVELHIERCEPSIYL